MPGYNYWVIVGPVVIALAIAVWLWMVARAAARRRKPVPGHEEDHGPVAGGRIQGGPSQVSRRDEAPRRG